MTLNHQGRSLDVNRIQLICVVGAGTIGAQVAQVAALQGYLVNLTDVNPVALERAVEGNRFQLHNRVNKGKLTPAQADEALSRVHIFTSLKEAAGSADFVIEAVSEDLELKRELFRKLDAICPPHAILASNSSAFVISQIARDIERKDKAVNMHFFHPALVMQLVEVVRGPETSDETVNVTLELAKRLGKETIVMNKEVFGFIVNDPMLAEMEAEINLKVKGYTSVDGRLNSNHSPSALEFADFSGVGVIDSARQRRYTDNNDPHNDPPPFLEEMVREGRLGRRIGRGF